MRNSQSKRMVADGSLKWEKNLTVAEFEGDRILIPADFVRRADSSRLSRNRLIRCWLLVVKPGRYRLVVESTDLSKMFRRIEEVGARGEVFDQIENDGRDAIGARVIPCTASPRGPGWRIHVPKEARILASGETSHVFLLIVGGFIEIWFPDTLRNAASLPISRILS